MAFRKVQAEKQVRCANCGFMLDLKWQVADPARKPPQVKLHMIRSTDGYTGTVACFICGHWTQYVGATESFSGSPGAPKPGGA